MIKKSKNNDLQIIKSSHRHSFYVWEAETTLVKLCLSLISQESYRLFRGEVKPPQNCAYKSRKEKKEREI